MSAPTPRLVHIVGARPNFPKAAPVIDALREHPVHQQVLHTGQHYDRELSQIFFDQLGLPAADIHLQVGSGSQAVQTAKVMVALEEEFSARRPDLVIVYGDVNSTLAAALVCAKLGIEFAHVEAGLRSFDRTMPEEVNRVVVDRLADLHLVTSVDAAAHLAREGTPPEQIHFVGNSMIDTLLRLRPQYTDDALDLPFERPAQYAVATLHRPGNVDSEANVAALVPTLHRVADQVELFFPVHPRGRQRMVAAGLASHPKVHLLDPLGYLQFLHLVAGAAVVVTDSGGVQEETTVLGVPCLTLRPNTERPVTISHGTNQLVSTDTLAGAVAGVLRAGRPQSWPTPPLWDGQAGPRIAQVVRAHLADRGLVRRSDGAGRTAGIRDGSPS